MENQDSTIESYTSKMPPGKRLKRGDVVDISTGDDGDKKPAASTFKKTEVHGTIPVGDDKSG